MWEGLPGAGKNRIGSTPAIERLLDEYNAAFEAAGSYKNADEVTLTPGLRKVIHELLANGGRVGPEAEEEGAIPAGG